MIERERVDGSVEMMELKDIFQKEINRRDNRMKIIKKSIEENKEIISQLEQNNSFYDAMVFSHKLAALYSELEVALREREMLKVTSYEDYRNRLKE